MISIESKIDCIPLYKVLQIEKEDLEDEPTVTTLDNYAQHSLGNYQHRYKEDYETVDEVNKRIMENLKIKQSSEATKSTEEAKVPEASSIQMVMSMT